jgi:hypothetical protein
VKITPLALLASSALVFPAVALAAPAQAGDVGTTDTIKNCSKTRYGVTVRIKLRDNGDFTRVRVSHPRGEGNFYAPRVVRVAGGAFGAGEATENLGGGVWRDKRRSLPPSFRTESTSVYSTVGVGAAFTLRNGKSIRLTCTLE